VTLVLLQAVARSVSDGAFLGPQLSTCLCALGEMGLQPQQPWLEAMTREAEYQVCARSAVQADP